MSSRRFPRGARRRLAAPGPAASRPGFPFSRGGGGGGVRASSCGRDSAAPDTAVEQGNVLESGFQGSTNCLLLGSCRPSAHGPGRNRHRRLPVAWPRVCLPLLCVINALCGGVEVEGSQKLPRGVCCDRHKRFPLPRFIGEECFMQLSLCRAEDKPSPPPMVLTQPQPDAPELSAELQRPVELIPP